MGGKGGGKGGCWGVVSEASLSFAHHSLLPSFPPSLPSFHRPLHLPAVPAEDGRGVCQGWELRRLHLQLQERPRTLPDRGRYVLLSSPSLSLSLLIFCICSSHCAASSFAPFPFDLTSASLKTELNSLSLPPARPWHGHGGRHYYPARKLPTSHAPLSIFP